jgi:hypothetical protein
MASQYDDAVAALYQAPLDQFVAERKRLAAELKAAGDKDGASRLAKLGRPTLSAWAVNQLWWNARDAFDELLASAERLRLGDLGVTRAHRDATASLRARAATLLTEGGHGAPEATLRRVTTTLSALAASGGFEPDAPGALAADRDPPGFGAAGFDALPAAPAAPAAAKPALAPATKAAAQEAKPAAPPAPRQKPEAAPKSAPRATAAKKDADARAAADAKAAAEAEVAERRRLEAERRAAEAEAERLEGERQREAEEQRRAERERIKKQAERQRVESALRLARRELDAHTREVERLEKELAKAQAARVPARAAVEELERKLAALGTGEGDDARE